MPDRLLLRLAEDAQQDALTTSTELQYRLQKVHVKSVRRVFRPEALASMKKRGLGVAGSLERWREIVLGGRWTSAEAARELQKSPEVEFAEPVLRGRADDLPDDPYLHSSGAWTQGHPDLWGVHQIGAPEAWENATGSDIVVAIIDTGVDIDHPDLTRNVWRNPGEQPNNGIDDDDNGYIDDVVGWNFSDNTPDITDSYGHGTHVAGIAAATGDNAIGIIGVAWQAKVMAVRVLDDQGYGDSADVGRGVVYAMANGADVINISLGFREFSQFLDDALAAAHELGVPVVVSAGNEGRPVRRYYPASSRYAMTVGASDTADELAFFSNYGVGVDVVAPGGDPRDDSNFNLHLNVLSLLSQQSIRRIGPTVDQIYMRLAGTSMSAPHVAGLTALLRETDRESSVEQLRQSIRRSAVPGVWNELTAYGRIDAARALETPRDCVARIFSPQSWPSGGSTAEITLSAWSEDLDHYALTLDVPAITVVNSGVPAFQEQVATLNTGELLDGLHSLHLVVSGPDGAVCEDRAEFELDRVQLDSPFEHTVLRGGETVEIRGRASGGAFSRFDIQIKEQHEPDWTPIEAVGDGLDPVEEGLLGSWMAPHLETATFFDLHLVVHRSGHPSLIERARILVDPTIRPGWPQRVPIDYAGPGLRLTMGGNLIAADLDLDGADELILSYANRVHVFTSSGEQLPGWPQQVSSRSTDEYVYPSAVVADLNQDGLPEVIVGTSEQRIFRWRPDGSSFAGWPKRLGSRAVVADLDNDQIPELITTGREVVNGRQRVVVRVVKSNGSPKPGWPVRIHPKSLAVVAPHAVADLDNDNMYEVIVTLAETPSTIHVLRHDGTPAAGWPVEAGRGWGWHPPAIGDLDGDRRLDVVWVSRDCFVHAYSGRGELLNGWPIPFHTLARDCGVPILGDLTGDGTHEVVVGAYSYDPHSGILGAWEADGSPLVGWPLVIEPEGDGNRASSPGFGASALVDIDGDRNAEIVASRGFGDLDYPTGLRIFEVDGTALAGSGQRSFDIADDHTTGPVVADLDGDGLVEFAWVDAEGIVYVWETGYLSVWSETGWPMHRHDPGLSGAMPPKSPLRNSGHRHGAPHP